MPVEHSEWVQFPSDTPIIRETIMKRDHTAGKSYVYWRNYTRKEFKQSWFMSAREAYLFYGEKKNYSLGNNSCFSRYLRSRKLGII